MHDMPRPDARAPVRRLAFGALLAASVLLAGCPQPQRDQPLATPPMTTPSPAPAQAPAPAPAPRVEQGPAARPAPSRALSLDAYKREVAARLLEMNSATTFQGRPPEILRAVVVVDVTINANGEPVRASVRRAPDHSRNLGDVAVQSFKASGPFPAPSPNVLRGARELSFIETWLFRDDGRFQIRTLAEAQ